MMFSSQYNSWSIYVHLLFAGWVLVFVCENCLVAQDRNRNKRNMYASFIQQRPLAGDDTAASLKKYDQQLIKVYGGKALNVPLDVKADHFEWQLRRYHQSPEGMVYHWSELYDQPGKRPTFHAGADVTTWQGSLLAALSFKYAVTKDRQTLKFIDDLLRGLRFSVTITSKPGLAVRCVLRAEKPPFAMPMKYVAEDGTTYFYRSEAAKGTYNQILCGYAAMFMFVADDFSQERQAELRDQLAELVIHLIDHKYHVTEKDGKRTKYGNIVPLVGSKGVPFNAQVAYFIVSTGYHFPPADPQKKLKISTAFHRLRNRHHVYYESPLKHLIVPQRVGSSVFVKGMNDKNHVLNAAYFSLMLEQYQARKENRQPDHKFLYQMGRTMYWTMESIEHERNALCNFMWSGMLSDATTFQVMLPHKKEQRKATWQRRAITLTGIEQLRRFHIDYFTKPGTAVKHKTPQWIDIGFPQEEYAWKQGPYSSWTITGPSTNTHSGRIDYLIAFWVMRYHKLFEQYHGGANDQ